MNKKNLNFCGGKCSILYLLYIVIGIGRYEKYHIGILSVSAHIHLDRGNACKAKTRVSAAIKTKVTIFISKNYLCISKIFKDIIKVTCSELLK